MFDFINVAFGWLMKWCYILVEKLGFGGYALALLLFAFICQLILFPFGIKQQKNSQKQASLRPKENIIRRRYNGRTDRNSQMKMNEEIQNLYQEEHFSPLSGCLPLLIQLPILFSLFYVIREPLTYISGLDASLILNINNYVADLGIEGFTVLEAIPKNFSEISLLNYINSNLPALTTEFPELADALIPNFQFTRFIDLSLKPDAFFNKTASWHIMLIPIATFASAYFGQKLTRRFTYQAPSVESASSMKLMNVMMPLFSAYLAFIWEASMGLYWTYRSILSFLQQMLLSKLFPIPTFTDEELRAQEKEYLAKLKGKSANKSKPVTDVPGRKSLIFDDDDEDGEMPAYQEHSIVAEDSETAHGSSLIDKAPLKDDEE